MQYMPGAHQPEGQEVFLHQGRCKASCTSAHLMVIGMVSSICVGILEERIGKRGTSLTSSAITAGSSMGAATD